MGRLSSLGRAFLPNKNRRNGAIIRFSLSSKGCFVITIFKVSRADSAVFRDLKIATNISSNCPDPCISHCFILGKFKVRYLVTIFTINLHYELQSYENPMKMSLKNQESIFQGTEYGDFIFMVYFACHEFSIKRQ